MLLGNERLLQILAAVSPLLRPGVFVLAHIMPVIVRHLTISDVVLLIPVLVLNLYRCRHAFVVCWAITTALMLLLSFLLSRLVSTLYQDPRPSTVVHLAFLTPFKPFLPHLMNNSFPSGHAVLTAAIVASVLLVSRRWSIPFVILGILVNWAREGGGIHHTIDVAGGWAIVAVATLIAVGLGTVITAVLLPRIPPSCTAERFRLRRTLLPQ